MEIFDATLDVLEWFHAKFLEVICQERLEFADQIGNFRVKTSVLNCSIFSINSIEIINTKFIFDIVSKLFWKLFCLIG
jgi:hypothetical protein